MGDMIQYDGGSASYESGSSVTLNSGTTTGVAGSWVELIAATDFDAACLIVDTYWDDGSNGGWVDVGIGGSGSEVMIAEGFDWHRYHTEYYFNQIRLPVQIPKGTRISARRANRYSAVDRFTYARASIFSMGINSPDPFQLCEKIGRVDVVNSTTASVKGSYAEVSSSLPATYRQVILSVTTDDLTTKSECSYNFDLALGAASSEVVVVSDYLHSIDSNSDNFIASVTTTLPFSLPEGERLSVRCSATVGSADNPAITIWGFR